jgi:hypothetical protein
MDIQKEQRDLTAALQRARVEPRSLNAHNVLQLQHRIGNQAVRRLLTERDQRRPANKGKGTPQVTIGPPSKDIQQNSKKASSYFRYPITSCIQRDLFYTQAFIANDPLWNASQFFEWVMQATDDEMFKAFKSGQYASDPDTHLSVSTIQLGKGAQFGHTGLIVVPASGDKPVVLEAMTDNDWSRVTPKSKIELAIQINIDKLGEAAVATPGAKLGVNEVFNTLVHELTLHAGPYFDVVQMIRAGNYTSGGDLAGVVRQGLQPGQRLAGTTQHQQLVEGTNPQYEKAVKKATELLPEMEKFAKNQGWDLNQYLRDVQLDRHTEEIALLNRRQESQVAELTAQVETTANNLTVETLGAARQALDKYKVALDAYAKRLSEIASVYNHEGLNRKVIHYATSANAIHEQLSARVTAMEDQLRQLEQRRLEQQQQEWLAYQTHLQQQQEWLAYQAHLQQQQWAQYQAALQQQWVSYYNSMNYPTVEKWHVYELHRILKIGKAEAYNLLTHPDDQIRLAAWKFLPQNH